MHFENLFMFDEKAFRDLHMATLEFLLLSFLYGCMIYEL
jgi:hypothetical protein